ncbi:MAG: PH domain-containing protein [Chloroflexi bacterium]|nr:PH domain-containing protein [Chloroflexota bacterium]
MSTSNELRARVAARIWQVIAQQDISDTGLAKEKQASLADALTDAVVAEISPMVEGARTNTSGIAGQQPTAAVSSDQLPPAEEQVLWKGRPLLSITKRYVITTERIQIITGLLSLSREDIELIRIQDIDQRRRFGQRLLGIGTVYIHSADPSAPWIRLSNITHAEEVHEIVRRAMLAQRRASNFAFRQEFDGSR